MHANPEHTRGTHRYRAAAEWLVTSAYCLSLALFGTTSVGLLPPGDSLTHP